MVPQAASQFHCKAACNQEMLFYNPSVRIIFVRIAAILSLIALAWSQNPPAAPQPAADISHVTCGEKPPFFSRVVRSETMVAPDGRRRAYTEVEARALYPQRPPGYSGPLCVNNSRLFLAEGPDFKIVFLQEPSDQETGNSLRPVDWSADSRRLLLELAEWQYETPAVTRSLLIYDSRNGTFQQPDLAQVFRKQFRIDCSLDIHLTGFTPEGKIVFETQPLSPEEEEVLSLPSCARKKETYEMDRTTETIIGLPNPPKLQRNAKVEPPPAK